MIFWLALVGLMTGSAAVDAMWQLGWGYDWQDVLGGLAMIAFGIVFLLMWNVMFRVIRALNHLFYAPDPDEEQPDGNRRGSS